MKKIQNGSRAKATFVFGETGLTYAFQYGASVCETDADYFEIKPARKFTSRRDWTQLYYGMAMGAAGIAAIAGHAYLFGATPLLALWLVPSAFLLTLFLIRPDHFRTLPTNTNPLWILEDRQATDIIAEIDLRRRDRLAEIYGETNLANATHLEINKIEWLVTEAVFTRDQADREIARIHAHLAEKAAAENAAGTEDFFVREALGA